MSKINYPCLKSTNVAALSELLFHTQAGNATYLLMHHVIQCNVKSDPFM